jgi:excisionase family DNA binding protein
MSKLKGCFMSLALSSELERFHTIREVAELLGYEKSSIYNLVNEGRLRCVKIGRGNRIPHSAVSEFVAKNIKPRGAYPSRGRTQRGPRA